MTLKHMPIGVGVAALAFAASLAIPAAAETVAHDAALKACNSAAASQPAVLVAAVDDGRGGSLVWLSDADAGLWLCHADEKGQVFAYTQMTGDLLEGAGANLVDIDIASEGEAELPEHDPLAVAERACQAYLPDGPGKVVGAGPDGLAGDWVPGYFVFIETGHGLFLCDATGDAQVWAFAEIGDPITLDNSVG